jgi:hypothetical protein
MIGIQALEAKITGSNFELGAVVSSINPTLPNWQQTKKKYGKTDGVYTALSRLIQLLHSFIPCILAVKAMTWSDSCAMASSFILSTFQLNTRGRKIKSNLSENPV